MDVVSVPSDRLVDLLLEILGAALADLQHTSSFLELSLQLSLGGEVKMDLVGNGRIWFQYVLIVLFFDSFATLSSLSHLTQQFLGNLVGMPKKMQQLWSWAIQL